MKKTLLLCLSVSMFFTMMACDLGNGNSTPSGTDLTGIWETTGVTLFGFDVNMVSTYTNGTFSQDIHIISFGSDATVAGDLSPATMNNVKVGDIFTLTATASSVAAVTVGDISKMIFTSVSSSSFTADYDEDNNGTYDVIGMIFIKQ